MKSDLISVTASGGGIKRALDQTEAVAVFKQLSHKDSLKLRLLTEEMMGMLQGLTGEVEAEFYIEDNDKDFKLHLITVTPMTGEKRRKLVEASTGGVNSAAVGIMGKLRSIFDRAFEPYDDSLPGFVSFDMVEMDPVGLISTWSLNEYRQILENKKETEEWDELERSIVANIADEIKVFIKGDNVEMIIYKKF